MGISFHYPQLLILLLLLPLIWLRLGNGRAAASTWLRLLTAILAVLALSQPRLERVGTGTDLIILVDRSASCDAETDVMLREITPFLQNGLSPADRTAVIGFADGARVERGFSGQLSPEPADGFANASDLAEGLRLVANLRDPARKTAVLCLTDGQYTDDDPLAPETVGALRTLPFWYRQVRLGAAPDVAAGELLLPDTVHPRSAWPVRFTLNANRAGTASYLLSRNGVTVAGGEVGVRRGRNAFSIRDVAADEDLLEYRLEVTAKDDAVAANNAGGGVVRVVGAPRVLLVSERAEGGLWKQILEAASIPVDHVMPEKFPEAPALLVPYRLVILENCRLTAFSRRGVRALAESVRAGLLSVLVSGGPNSFGAGGYHRSEIDPLLPVEIELRNDLRRRGMAVAFALDRSGSMSLPAGHGVSKMDLANLGAAESIRLLSPRDRVSVIAVDSDAHVVIPLAAADATEELAEVILGIKAMGGGIFCHTALSAAAEQMRGADVRQRHIILFADADDAEEQEGCIELAKELQREGIAISVVAMGDENDSDAGFLRELATAGGGEALFSNEASGLPALFTSEIMRISQRSFIEEKTVPVPLPALSGLGLAALPSPPELGGYNIAALREGATAYLRVDDELHTPLLAIRQWGAAAAGALLFEVEGEFAGGFSRWAATPELLTALVRRLAPGAAPAGVKFYSSLRRGVARARLEMSRDAAAALRLRGSEAVIRWLGPGGFVRETELTWTGPDMAEAELRPTVPGHYLPVLETSAALAGPAVTLAYSPEHALGDATAGKGVLTRLAAVTRGGDALDLSRVRKSARALEPAGRELFGWLVLAAIMVFLLELAGRRLHLFN